MITPRDKSDIQELYDALYKTDNLVLSGISGGSMKCDEVEALNETIVKVSQLEAELKKWVEVKLKSQTLNDTCLMEAYTDLLKIYLLRRCLPLISEENRLRVLKDKYSTVKSSQPEYYYLQQRIGSYTANEIDFLRIILPADSMPNERDLPDVWQEIVHNKRNTEWIISYGDVDWFTRISLIGYAYDELRKVSKKMRNIELYRGTIKCPKLQLVKSKCQQSEEGALTFAELNLILSERIGGLTESEARLRDNLPSVNSNIPFYDVLVRHNKLKDIMEAFKNKYDPWDCVDSCLPDTQYTRRLSKKRRDSLYPTFSDRNYRQYLMAIVDLKDLAKDEGSSSLKNFINRFPYSDNIFYHYRKEDFLKNPFARFIHYESLLRQYRRRMCWESWRTSNRDYYHRSSHWKDLDMDEEMIKIWNMGDKVDILKTYGNIKGNTNGDSTGNMTFSDAGKKIFDDVWKLGNINSDIVKSLKITDEERESFAGTLTRFLHQYKECRVDDLDSIITSKTVQESFERTKGAPTEDILMLFVPYLNPQCLEGSQKIERSDYAVEVKNIDLWNLYRKWFKKTYLNLLV